MGQWGKIFLEGGRRLGRPFSILEDEIQKKGLEEAGFVDIDHQDLNVSSLPSQRSNASAYENAKL